MKTVAVFFGGNSNEHEISVITGMYAVNLLRGCYRVLPVFLPRTGGLQLATEARGVKEFQHGSFGQPAFFVPGGIALKKKPKRPILIDCALNCCHGGAGEDGTLSALLSWYAIKSASPALAPSAVFMDKVLTKLALKGLGIPVIEGVFVREGEHVEVPFPAIVKPATLGSSIGISVVHNEEELNSALALCFRLDATALIERYLPEKRDLNCACYEENGRFVLSEVEEVFSKEAILTFGEKYEGESRSQIPAAVLPEQREQIHGFLTKIYRTFGLCGVVRADFLLCGEQIYLNELNTVPGSLSAYLFGSSLTQAKTHCIRLVEEGLRRERVEKQILETGILSQNIFSGGKRAKLR